MLLVTPEQRTVRLGFPRAGAFRSFGRQKNKIERLELNPSELLRLKTVENIMTTHCITPYLPKLLELVSLGLANGANPVGRQILECRIGRYPAFNITKLRVVNPFANLATVLLHLFHVV